ncbi:hypothetical protein MRX96_046681 [Rhipicephalus microplus]
MSLTQGCDYVMDDHRSSALWETGGASVFRGCCLRGLDMERSRVTFLSTTRGGASFEAMKKTMKKVGRSPTVRPDLSHLVCLPGARFQGRACPDSVVPATKEASSAGGALLRCPSCMGGIG